MIFRFRAAGEQRTSSEYSSRLAITASFPASSGINSEARSGPNFCGKIAWQPDSRSSAWACWPARATPEAVISTCHDMRLSLMSQVWLCQPYVVELRSVSALEREACGDGTRLHAL